MPAMTREQYHARGAADADARRPPAALRAGTWQAAAYNKGFAGVPLDGSEQPRTHTRMPAAGRGIVPPPIAPGTRKSGDVLAGVPSLAAALEARRKFRFSHWPEAASEHLRCLANDAATCRDPARVERLMRAAGRMTKRYGPPKAIPDNHPTNQGPTL